jgi:hypothetical protein
MTNYETLRKQVYDILYPDGIPLEVGCELLEKDSNPIVTYIGRKKYDGTVEVINWTCWETREEIESRYTILGKPLSLSDVLRAMDKKDVEDAPLFSTEGQLMYYDPETGSMRLSGVFIDLTKPLSDPANDEACLAISTLLKV